MKINPTLIPWLIVLVWLLTGVGSILLIAIENKKRLGGEWFYHIKADIDRSPVPALLGYFFAFVFGWLTILGHCITFVFDAIRFLILFPKRLRSKKG